MLTRLHIGGVVVKGFPMRDPTRALGAAPAATTLAGCSTTVPPAKPVSAILSTSLPMDRIQSYPSSLIAHRSRLLRDFLDVHRGLTGLP